MERLRPLLAISLLDGICSFAPRRILSEPPLGFRDIAFAEADFGPVFAALSAGLGLRAAVCILALVVVIFAGLTAFFAGTCFDGLDSLEGFGFITGFGFTTGFDLVFIAGFGAGFACTRFFAGLTGWAGFFAPAFFGADGRAGAAVFRTGRTGFAGFFTDDLDFAAFFTTVIPPHDIDAPVADIRVATTLSHRRQNAPATLTFLAGSGIYSYLHLIIRKQ